MTLSPENFEVQTVSSLGQKAGEGSFGGSFSMGLSSVSEQRERFIMGSALQVEIGWSARFLSEFSVKVDECTVSHGDLSIAVIKARWH